MTAVHVLIEHYFYIKAKFLPHGFILTDFSSQDNSHDHRPLLFPCSNLKRETLPRVLREAGLGLDSLNCYNTEPHPDILSNLHSLLEMLSISDGSSLYTVFFSPSGVNYALDKILTIFEDKVSIKVCVPLDLFPGFC